MVFWLGLSTASLSCACGYKAFHALPYRPGKPQKKRGQVKIRATRISYTELFCNVVENFYFITTPVVLVTELISYAAVQISSRGSFQASLLTYPRKAQCGN